MLAAHRDRLWAGGGGVGAVALLLLGWLLFISPQAQETEELRGQVTAGQSRLVTLQRRLVELRQQNGNLERYRTQLVRDRQALPVTSGLADFLRELEAAGAATGVSVTSAVIGSSTSTTVGDTQIFVLPVTLVVSGSAAGLESFLDQVQRVQPRAVLINNVSVAPDGMGHSLDEAVTLTLNAQAFVAAPPGSASQQDAGQTVPPQAQGAGDGTGSLPG